MNQRRVLNLANPTALPLSNLTQYYDGGTQGSNGLLLSATYRLRNGWTMNGNYTWSHCIGIMSNITVLNPGANYIHSGYGSNLPGSNDRNLDAGNCNTDRRQIANITFVYQTPSYSNKMAHVLASGWTLASAIQVRSGQALTLREPIRILPPASAEMLRERSAPIKSCPIFMPPTRAHRAAPPLFASNG